MTAEEARNAVKDRLDIPVGTATFDDKIDDFVDSAVKRLFPIVQREVPVQTETVTVDDYGEAVVDLSILSTPVEDRRFVEANSGGAWSEASITHVHASNLYVRELDSSVTQLRIFGLTRFKLTDLTDEFELPVLWYAVSEFYDYLAGNKRQYNEYVDSGAQAVDNMRDQSSYFEGKANAYISDRATMYGAD